MFGCCGSFAFQKTGAYRAGFIRKAFCWFSCQTHYDEFHEPLRVQVLGLLLAVILQTSALAGPRDAQWQAVQDAVNKGLPQTAITNLEPIIAAAMKEKAYAEATKAIGQKIALEGNIQGNQAEERVVRLEAEIAQAPVEMKPVLQTLLAHWYWSYYQRNRWRFMQRTQTAEAPGKDFTTWDLPRLFAEIDKNFQAALAADKNLKATPIAAWDGLLEKGTMPDSYRPTLYDFLAHERCNFTPAANRPAQRRKVNSNCCGQPHPG